MRDRELWREEAKLDSIKRNAEQEYERAERFLSHMMDRDTSRGLASIRRIKAQGQLQGLHGTLAELFDVSDKFKTAVEVTAGASLFHYVVDTEETAAKAVEQLYKEKAGRITFMPLNKLQQKPSNIPKANDAIEMVTKLNYDEKFDRALRHVFGRTIICPNLQIAAQYARSHGVSAITPDGDRSDKKGALTGGYIDPRQSRLDAVKTMTKWKAQCEEHTQRLREITKQLETLAQDVTQSVSDLQKAEQKKQQFEKCYGPMQQELRSRVLDIQSKRDALGAKQRSKANVDSNLRELGDQQSAYEAELASEFKKALSTAEEQQLEHLSASIPDLRKRFAELSNRRSELEAQKSTIEVELRENLRPRLDQLKSQELESGSTGQNSKLKARQQDLKRAGDGFDSAEQKYQEALQTLDEAATSLNDANQKRASKQQEQEDVARSIEKSQKRSEKSAAKRALLAEKAAEASRNIRDLGMVPDDAYSTKYSSVSSEKVGIYEHTAGC